MDSHELQQRYAQGDRHFPKADFSGQDLSGLDLRDTDFSGADFYGAKLMDSLLNRTNFGSANLAYADLRGADLREASLQGASLEGTNLEGAIAHGAIYDAKTQFPVGFDPTTAGAVDAAELDRRSRIVQITALKAQAEQANSPPPEPVSATFLSSPSEQTLTSVTTANGTPEIADPSAFLPPTEIKQTPTVPPPATLQKTSSSSCVGVLVGLFTVLGLGFAAISLWKAPPTAPANPFETVPFPLPACGDPPERFGNRSYPVYVNYAPDVLDAVVSKFCRDAYVVKRENSGTQSIQVASFATPERAEQFARFMQQKVGSGEVGIPNQR